MRLILVPAVALVVLGLAGGPASAERWHGRDAHKDVHAYEVGLAGRCETVTEGDRLPDDQHRDITKLAVDHRTDAVVVELSLRDVARHDRKTSYAVDVRTPGLTYEVQVYAGPSKQPLADFSSVRPGWDPEGCGATLSSHPRKCDALAVDVDPRANRMTATIPRSCLGQPRWVRVAAAAGGVDYDDLTSQSPVLELEADGWGRGPLDLESVLTTFGPKVHVG